jgi:Flp pilus assembly protein TadD
VGWSLWSVIGACLVYPLGAQTPAAGGYLDPRSGAAHTNLGLALMQRGDAVESRESLEAAVRVSPDLFAAHLHLGELLLLLGDSAAGRAHLKRAAESPDARVRTAATKLLSGK